MSTANSSEYASLLEVGQVVIFPVVTVLVMSIIYGFYIALFSLCIYLLRQGNMRHQTPYVWSTVTLFVIASAMVAAETTYELQKSIVAFTSAKTRDILPLLSYLTHDKLKTIIVVLILILPILANIIADFILIHRCYVAWGSAKRILVPLVLTSCAVNVVYSAGAIMYIFGMRDEAIESNLYWFKQGLFVQALGLIMSASFNSVLTLLTAGRIWWITRCAIRSSRTHVLTTMNKIILESGMLYPLVTILHLAVTNAYPAYQIPFDTFPPVVLAAGIAPTLIIVRIRLRASSPLGEDDTVTQPPQSSLFLNSFLQPTQSRSVYLSPLSVVGRRTSLIEGDNIKSLPKALQAMHAI
ncbi:hypothetical protein L218DRAFT_965956 [Marasmius fiardii PR-910]|nr:hypothetical protein L218DRAFT_965956 [Marasmius fiardii PR-910]